MPVLGGALALLAALTHAHGQAPQRDDAGPPGKVRILAVNAPPLAGHNLPEGGLVPALVNASLSLAASAGIGPETTLRWSKGALTQQVLEDQTVDLSLPVESANCERPSELTQSSAMLCDGAAYSDPVLQVVLGLFTLASSSFKFDNDDSVLGKTLCLFREHDLSALNSGGRNWAAYKRVTVTWRPTLLDCVAAVQAHDADAFAAVDLEGTYLLRQLGLTPYFTMQARPLATRGIHAVVSREHPRAAELIAALNLGLKRLKAGGAYAAIVQRHLAGTHVAAAGVAASVPAAVASRRDDSPAVVPPAKPAAPAKPVAAARAKAEPAAPTKAEPIAPTKAEPAAPTKAEPVAPAKAEAAPVKPDAAPPKVAAAPASPPAAKPPAPEPPAPPLLNPASRQTALRFLKRGMEELNEGRVAPARLLFERAAEMGLADAALALGATYDAAELNQPHLRNVLPDAAEARRWYERAHALGAADANAKLRRLGARQ